MTIVSQSLTTIEVPEWMNEHLSCDIPIIDSLINGDGPHPGQIITVSAPRGAGKTTLLLQILNGMQKKNPFIKSLYLSKEEPSFQLKKTAMRVGVNQDIQVIGDEVDSTIPDILELLPKFQVIVLDSFSMLHNDGVEGDRMKILKDAAKASKTLLFCILHQTKSGVSRGSSTIEHLADSVLDVARADSELFGTDNVRIITMEKNRFGTTGQVILRLEKDGWNFEDPVEAHNMNEDNKRETRNSPQAKKPKELSSILALFKDDKNRISFTELIPLIPQDDPNAAGRFQRHLKELETYGKVIKIGRGGDAVWEIVKPS